MQPTRKSLLQTYELIKDHIIKTPILTSNFLTNQVKCKELYFKAENLQKGGAFKARGACNAMFQISEPIVCTHSSGNHGIAVSLMAQKLSKKAYIVMPDNTPQVKIDLVREFGGEIIFSGPTIKSREETLDNVSKEFGGVVIPPYNDWNVISGQATSSMEIYEEIPDLDYILVPIGGGGLCSGTLLATKYFSPQTKVIGVEPLLASDAKQSLISGKIEPQMPPITIADGLRTSLGTLTFQTIKENIHDIMTVDEKEMVLSTFLIWHHMKLQVEVSSATVLAAAIKHKDMFLNKRVAVILSGGNVDINALINFLKLQ